jgi:hypothetical protein
MVVGNMHVDCFSIGGFLTFVAVKTRPNWRLPHVIFISPTFQTLKWLGIFIHLWSCLVTVVKGTRHDQLKHVLKCQHICSREKRDLKRKHLVPSYENIFQRDKRADETPCDFVHGFKMSCNFEKKLSEGQVKSSTFHMLS